MIVAIDGPAGAGKSTTARALAQRFGWAYVDTGAMYRALSLAASEAALQPGAHDEQIIALAQSLPLAFRENGRRIFIGARDVSELIRTPEIGELTSAISTIAAVREVVVDQQRRVARVGESECGGAVLEGRDIQTVVFPEAEVKIYLTADPLTRAERRFTQWDEKVSLEEAARDIEGRDQRDSTRKASPLKPALDAVHLATDGLSPAEVVSRIAAIIENRLPGVTTP
jgi:cytidylate kinase